MYGNRVNRDHESRANNKTLVLALAAIAALGSTAALAQQLLEEVVVTAQKREQSIQDVPIAISVFGSEDLKRLNVEDMSELQYSTPNLTVSYNSKAIPRLGLRGISDYSRNPGYDNRVSVYVDGIYAGRSAASNQSTLDIERIEVLRGPQGTLFGKNTVAGAISISTRKPTGEFGGSAKVEVGNFDYLSLTGTLSGALVEDRLFAKLMVNDRQRDGYLKNIYNDKVLNGLDEWSARLQLRWLLDQGEVNFSMDKSGDDTDSLSSWAVNDRFAPDPYEISINHDAIQIIDTFGAGVTVDYTLPGDFEITSITGYRETDFISSIDEDFAPFPVATSRTTEDSSHFSQELRLSSPVGEKYDYILGLYYLDQTNESTTSAIGDILFPIPNSFVTVPATVDVTSFAAFTHGNYRLSDRWELTGGLRFTYEEKKLDYVITDTTGLFTNGSLNDDRDASNISPKLGMNFFLNDEIMFYTNYAKSFKSGGWNADFISTFEQIAFDDEQVASYELGMKSTLADGRVRLNAALYTAKYTDFQVFQFVPLATGGTILTITNAGEVTAQGFEADVNWAVSESFTLWATFGYSDSTFDEFKDGGGPGIDYDGNDTVDAPSYTYSLGLQFRHPIGSFGELVASADYSYRDDFYTNPNNLDVNRVDGYDLANARIGIESNSGKWSVFLWGRNLADASDLTDQSISFLGIQRGSRLQPRTFGATFLYRFGAL